jgi:nitroimidazol reductase NimA-like FMN-containing flavoprotein (pyridoxamine 5'-phosphate oxidase superfamily)
MDQAQVGYLSFQLENGFPRVVPLDFVVLDDKIYFHGAQHGEKHKIFAADPKVSFCAVVPFSIIPSYWQSQDYACRVSHFYRSALAYGRGSLVDDVAEKAEALQSLMKKYQPEGGFRRIDPANPHYRKPLEEVAIYRIDVERVTTRISVGQALDKKARLRLIDELERRNRGADLATAEAIRKTLS